MLPCQPCLCLRLAMALAAKFGYWLLATSHPCGHALQVIILLMGAVRSTNLANCSMHAWLLDEIASGDQKRCNDLVSPESSSHIRHLAA